MARETVRLSLADLDQAMAEGTQDALFDGPKCAFCSKVKTDSVKLQLCARCKKWKYCTIKSNSPRSSKTKNRQTLPYNTNTTSATAGRTKSKYSVELPQQANSCVRKERDME
ncbi:hypothetical protein BDZ45DRAFT_747560 [Acephala macrosclerotiorum]|nr:hypothetical protein BDZ45DRAFT_747560 [Acephala macrosclerotiorum]